MIPAFADHFGADAGGIAERAAAPDTLPPLTAGGLAWRPATVDDAPALTALLGRYGLVAGADRFDGGSPIVAGQTLPASAATADAVAAPVAESSWTSSGWLRSASARSMARWQGHATLAGPGASG